MIFLSILGGEKVSINQKLFKKVLVNISEFKKSADLETFAIETSAISKDIRDGISNSMLVSPEKLKMRIGI